jgi:hypothetical protein
VDRLAGNGEFDQPIEEDERASTHWSTITFSFPAATRFAVGLWRDGID